MKHLDERVLARLLAFTFMIILGLLTLRCVLAKPPPVNVKAKFYDFSEQLIDGTVKKPQALYTDVRQAAKFKRLLRLKKSMMKELFDTAKDPIFK